ncbi:hypothetical protein [uncultured Photobacterium sp.]|uniref:hypothetical protein n=1 Tax=uncultured Photobacterium sp. TaxID=173973 RepID=UPI0026178AB6|nr:hypothetical protein [uncultured Photobacterium sp.]
MYKDLCKYYRYFMLIFVIGISAYYAHHHWQQSSLSLDMVVVEPVVVASNTIKHDIVPMPENFDVLIAEDKEIVVEQQELLALQPHHYDEEIPVINGRNSPTINENINLLIGSDLWVYKPYLKEDIEREQQLSLPNDTTAMQVDDAVLNQLVLGDSLMLSLPNKGTQQVIIASIQREKNDVTIWELQNSQRQNIGKITQIKEIKEGSFITDDKQEYHLRTVRNKGWIASKKQLIKNNNQSVTNNKKPFIDQYLNMK